MVEKTNVVELFGNRDAKRKPTSKVREDTSQSTANVVSQEELELHQSFSYDNVLAALIANRYIQEDETTKQAWLNSREHEYKVLMSVLYQYIKNSMDNHVGTYGFEVMWGGSTLNSLLLIEKNNNVIECEFSVELYVHEDGVTDIRILDQEGVITAMISKNELAVG